MIQSKPSEKGEIITYLSRMGDVLKYIADSGKLVFSACTVNTVIDGDKVYAKLREKNIRIHTHLQIVAPESAHILNNQCSDIACFNFFYQRLKAWAIEIYTRKTIVSKMADILKTIPTGIIFEVFFLIGNGITLAIQVIIS